MAVLLMNLREKDKIGWESQEEVVLCFCFLFCFFLLVGVWLVCFCFFSFQIDQLTIWVQKLLNKPNRGDW